MNTLTGKYLMYRGKPLVREGQQICWGDMNDKYVLVLGIMSTKKVKDKELPDQVLIQIQSTEDGKVVKVGSKNGLYEAFEYGVIWLETELKNG
ncbi:MAG: hypothetical protein HFE63_09350 [Clostridiales bacterium]|nr:hypothetical protein [Clostridiales bacterium]